MTLSELITSLLHIQESLPDQDPEVRVAMQPSWPLEYTIDQVLEADFSADARQECQDFLRDADPVQDAEAVEAAKAMLDDLKPTPVIYLSEGSQIGYLPGSVSRELGWR